MIKNKELEPNEIGIIILKLLEVVRETEEKRLNSEYTSKEGEEAKKLCTEYEERILHAGGEILSELERINKSGEVINPVVFFINKVTELAEIETEAERKIKSLERTAEDCIFTYAFKGVGVFGAYMSMSHKIISECLKMIKDADNVKLSIESRGEHCSPDCCV